MGQHARSPSRLISTFHSFCVRILRRDVEALRDVKSNPRQGPHARLRLRSSTRTINRQLVKADHEAAWGSTTKQLTPRNVLSRISWAKNHMVDPQEVLSSAPKTPRCERVAHIYKAYQDELAQEQRAWTSTTCCLRAVRLLKSDAAEVRERYQRRYRIPVLVDEYQDTNRPQYELMKLAGRRESQKRLRGRRRGSEHLFLARRRHSQYPRASRKTFPTPSIIRLEQNYRSTQPILKLPARWLPTTCGARAKTLWTERAGRLARSATTTRPDGENEALFIADFISGVPARV
jgi:DNA helicase II / ATP-dependent DNA helicase PcrA